MHAVDALIDVDVTFGMNRLSRTFIGATLTWRAAFGPAPQPLEHADVAGNCERRTERAHVAAEKPFDEQSRGQRRQSVDDERPFAREFTARGPRIGVPRRS